MVGYSSITTPRQIVLPQSAVIFEENVFCKRVSGRTVQLDKIAKSS